MQQQPPVQCLPTSRHDRFVSESKLQFGSGLAHITATKKPLLHEILQDEAKRIANYETKTDRFDLTKRSGRAVKIE